MRDLKNCFLITILEDLINKVQCLIVFTICFEYVFFFSHMEIQWNKNKYLLCIYYKHFYTYIWADIEVLHALDGEYFLEKCVTIEN